MWPNTLPPGAIWRTSTQKKTVVETETHPSEKEIHLPNLYISVFKMWVFRQPTKKSSRIVDSKSLAPRIHVLSRFTSVPSNAHVVKIEVAKHVAAEATMSRWWACDLEPFAACDWKALTAHFLHNYCSNGEHFSTSAVWSWWAKSTPSTTAPWGSVRGWADGARRKA